MLAPIVLFVYNRPEHTKATVEALSRNILAKDSELFVFSDGFKDGKLDKRVIETREYIDILKEKIWFKKVRLIKAEQNKGLANSVIEGVSNVIDQYGKVIVVEDDIVTAPYFLTYMNQALDYYMENKKIWSISGYTFPMKSLEKYGKDVFLSYRGCSWGWGTWKNRWELVDWDISDYDAFKTDKKKVHQFERGGRDLPAMLASQRQGKIDSWAVRWCYWESKCDMLTVYPTVSLVRNIGYDGSGTHDGDEDVFGNSLIEIEGKEYKFSEIELSRKILSEFYEIYSATLIFRIKKKLKKFWKEKRNFYE